MEDVLMKMMMTALIVLMQSVPLWATTNATPASVYTRYDVATTNLPPGCVLANCSPYGRSPRPYVTATEKDIRFISQMSIGALVDYSQTREMFVLCFKEKGDIGIYGWRLASADAAQAMLTKVAAKYPNDPTVSVWRTGDVVVMLWREDRVTASCFEYFKRHIERVVASDK